MVKKIIGAFLAALVLVVVAKFFLPGAAESWLVVIFAALLYQLLGRNQFRDARIFLFAVLASVVFVNLVARISGRSLEAAASGQDDLALLLYVSLLGLLAAKEAGWTPGTWGKRAIVSTFVAVFVYALLAAKLPDLPRAADRGFYETNVVLKGFADGPSGGSKEERESRPKPGPAPAAYTRGARFELPELCPDPGLSRRLEQGETVDWELGDRPGCNAENFKIESGEAEVAFVYGSGDKEGPFKMSPTTPNSTFRERKIAISMKALTPVVTYRAF